MKYYSEITGELFDTVEELNNAERELKAKEEEKARLENEIQEAYREAVEAFDRYIELSRKNGVKRVTLPDSMFSQLIDDLFG